MVPEGQGAGMKAVCTVELVVDFNQRDVDEEVLRDGIKAMLGDEKIESIGGETVITVLEVRGVERLAEVE